jgi:hypothetical protein
MKHRTIFTRLAIFAMAAATALLLSGPAQASVTTSHTHKISGNEYIAGAVFGKAALANTPTFPLRWRGLIRQRSQFTVPGGNGGKGSSATLPSRKGGLELTLTSNFAFKLLYMNKRTCYSIGQTKATLMVDGATGTGLFKDASGNGSVTQIFGAFLPKNKNGTCNINGNPTNPRDAFAVIIIKITPLTFVVHHHHR